MTRAVVITSLQPPLDGKAQHGTYKRIRLFVNALQNICETIELVYSVADVDFSPDVDLRIAEANHAATERDYWRAAVTPHFVRRRARRKTFRHEYIDGIVSGAEQPPYFRWAGPDQAEAIGRLLDTEPDLVVVNNLHAMLAVLRSKRRPRAMFFDMDDVQHRVRFRWCRQPPIRPSKLLHLAQIPALLASEFKAASRSKSTFVCSELDRRHLSALGFPRVRVIPNAVASRTDLPHLTNSPTLLFVGSAGHPPNAEAATHMVTRIFPLIEAANPEVRLLVAGPGTDSLPCRAAASRRIEFLGFVDDLASIYARSRVFVCPMLNGGGTRIKLIDAAANGIPIVSTTMGAEGLDFRDGEAIILADNDQAFAASCLRLIQSDEIALSLRSNASYEMKRQYDAKIIEERLVEIFASQI